MSKYTPLWEHIKANSSEKITLSFDEIEKIATAMDHSFLNYKKELTDYGYCVKKISMKGQTVLFEKLKEDNDIKGPET